MLGRLTPSILGGADFKFGQIKQIQRKGDTNFIF